MPTSDVISVMVAMTALLGALYAVLKLILPYVAKSKREAELEEVVEQLSDAANGWLVQVVPPQAEVWVMNADVETPIAQVRVLLARERLITALNRAAQLRKRGI
jgi:hypothetical protein